MEFGYARIDTGDTQVDGGPCMEAGDSGTDTGNTQVGGGACASGGAGAGEIPSLVFGTSRRDDGDRRRDRLQGSV